MCIPCPEAKLTYGCVLSALQKKEPFPHQSKHPFLKKKYCTQPFCGNFYIQNSSYINILKIDVDIIYNINMDYECFLNWLIESKNLSNHSTKDVVSRCKRICKLNNNTKLNKIDYDNFIFSEIFSLQSMFIKSQLKRAFKLYLEFRSSK